MITEPKHPYVMVSIIFLMCISAGILIGYMAVNMPEFPEIFQKTPGEPERYDGTGVYRPQQTSGYETVYRSYFEVDYSEIPEDTTITSANWSWYAPQGNTTYNTTWEDGKVRVS